MTRAACNALHLSRLVGKVLAIASPPTVASSIVSAVRAVSPEFLHALKRDIPTLNISVDADDLVHYARDWTRFSLPRAGAVAFPRSSNEVARVLDVARAHGVGVVPSAGRTGLAGGACATRGELVLSVEKIDFIDPVDVASATVRVGAGAILATVQDRAKDASLYFPVDLGSRGSCRIGGNIATNAGGLRVIRYGTMRHWVVGLSVALSSGEVLALGGGLEKNNTGYDLRQLFIGSEGTLGVITEATLKLTRPPAESETALFALSSFEHVLGLLECARRTRLSLLSFEFFSESCRREVEAHGRAKSPFSTSHPYYVLIEAERLEPSLEHFIASDAVLAIVDDGVLASSSRQARDLWALRERITESLAERGLVHKADVAVAVRDLAPFVAEVEVMLARDFPRLEVFLFGHVGDGNVHVNLPRPAALDEETFRDDVKRADVALSAVLERFRGSVSAEHGIGLLKKEILRYTRTPTEIALFRAMKRVLDDAAILNPGKIFDEE
jgi:FAD/FMN-containing dehydrogenase